MLKNYLKIAWRNLFKNQVLSIINLSSLSVGIAAIMLIAIYINNEYKYDNFHDNESNLFRVGFKTWQSGKVIGSGATFISEFGPDAKDELPEIQSFVRVSYDQEAYVSSDVDAFQLSEIRYADPQFFGVLSYKLLKGNPETALEKPFTVVLTETTAERIFGTDQAIGNTIKLNDQTEYLVTGIAEDPPLNSHLRYKALISFQTLYKDPEYYMGWNGGNQYITYFLLSDNVNRSAFAMKLKDFMWTHINEDYSNIDLRIDAELQPISDVHLYYSDNSEMLRTNLNIFTLVALLIMVISSINYVNLTTAQSVTRLKEIGVRKILGANKTQVVKQFLGETLLISLISSVFAIVLVILLLPAYRELFNISLALDYNEVLVGLLVLLVFIVFVSIIAGSYLAFYLTSFNVNETFKLNLPKPSSPFNFRRGLIVAQFVISIGLMASTIFISLQMEFIKSKDQGINREQILALPLIGENAQKHYTTLKNELLKLPEVKNISGVSEIPYDGVERNGFKPEKSDKRLLIHQLDVDENFLETFDVNLVQGSFFSGQSQTLGEGFVINETLANLLGWDNPIGKTISRDGDHKIVGVVQDFNFASLHEKIKPLIITNRPYDGNYSLLAIKYHAGQSLDITDKTEQLWSDILNNTPFNYWFLDDAFDTVYKSEKRFQKVFFYFSILSVFLSLVGIFGLVLLMLKRRTKEMGVRKVLGANLMDIGRIVVVDFIWLIVIAAIIATPICWYYMNSWLQNFAYRIEIHWWVFAITLLVTVLAVGLTVSMQTIKTALRNPIDSLRTE